MFFDHSRLVFSVIFCNITSIISFCAGNSSVRVNTLWSVENPVIDLPLIDPNKAFDFLIWTPKNSNVSVFVSSSRDGSINRIAWISKAAQVNICHVIISDSLETLYPCWLLRYYNKGKDARYIQSIKAESGWEFFLRGDTQPFEDVANYSKKKIRDRFNRKVIVDYFLKIGIDISSDLFWTSDSEPYRFVDKWYVKYKNLPIHKEQ